MSGTSDVVAGRTDLPRYAYQVLGVKSDIRWHGARHRPDVGAEWTGMRRVPSPNWAFRFPILRGS